MSWAPSPALAKTVRQALVTMHAFYPRSLALAEAQSDASGAWVETYCRAFLGKRISLDAIKAAAVRWPAEMGKATPFPKEFATFAHAIERELFPRAPMQAASVDAQPLPLSYEDTQRIEQCSQRIKQSMASWREVAEVWSLIYSSAQNDASRQAARVGNVPVDVVNDAVAAHQRGMRSIPGPLASAVL